MPTTDSQTITETLRSLGVNSLGGGFSWANIAAGLIFGIIGWCMFNYGRKEKELKPTLIGLVLMVYPYFVPNTVLLYLIGIALTALLYFWRD